MTNLTTNTSERAEPGTLVWVGPTQHPEFCDAFQFCRTNAAQLAVRRDHEQLVARPAGFVKRIVFVREDRSPLSVNCFQQLADRYRDAEFLALTSSLCDGEARTGSPWPGIKHLRFSRWNEFFPHWIEPCGYLQPVTKPAKSVLFLADRLETAEPYLDAASSMGIRISWKRTYVPLTDRNVDLLIWDESIAKPTSIALWRRRLQANDQTSLAAVCARHIWLTTSPRASDISDAVRGGITNIFCKPATWYSLFQWKQS